MSGAFKHLVELRKKIKKKIPTFKRVNASRYAVKLGDKWRKQRGRHNKIRKKIKGAGARVSIGYGSLSDARHLHPAGYEEIRVENIKDLDKVTDTSKQAVRIAASVGLKKRLEILKEAKKRGIHVLNARVVARVKKKGYSTLSDMLGAIGSKSKIKEEAESQEVSDSQELKNQEMTKKKKKVEDTSEKTKKKKITNKSKKEGSEK